MIWLGEFAPAREHFARGIALYNLQQHRSLAFIYGGYDPGLACLFWATWVLWQLGYPDQALQKIHEALTLARELSHPHSMTVAFICTAIAHQFRREVQVVQERVKDAIILSTEQGFPFWSAQGTILRGWVLAEQGHGEQGIAQMQQGLAASRVAGAECGRPYFLSLLAEGYGKVGQIEEGLSVLAEALAMVDKNGERMWEAELYRRKGELTLQSHCQSPESPTREAEACFQKAIEVARRQSAKSLELRAVMSLARLWLQQGRRAEARQRLAEVYGWFTEGFDTKDLQEAKTLLAALAEDR